MLTLTDEQVSMLRAGQDVIVRQGDEYETRGRVIGLTRDADGSKLRLLGPDRLERRIPLPAQVKHA